VPKQVGENSHTHDWEVWVRGVADASGKRDKIEHFIDKVYILYCCVCVINNFFLILLLCTGGVSYALFIAVDL
jgi:cation transport ATPase